MRWDQTQCSCGNKSPEDLSALRVERVTSSSTASAPFLTATFRAMTSFLPAIVAAMVITALIAIVVARGDIHDRAARCDRPIHDHRRWAFHHGRRAWRGVNNDRTRRVKDWHGQPKIEADRNSCLGGADQSDCGNHCYQTEQIFCFHGGSDGAVFGVFDSRPLIKTGGLLMQAMAQAQSALPQYFDNLGRPYRRGNSSLGRDAKCQYEPVKSRGQSRR